ncbi:MAG: hypothetical protein IKM98_04585 [Bacteroidales bacterium]|nr:hypothetical protein [Bacteroidales bacterium]
MPKDWSWYIAIFSPSVARWSPEPTRRKVFTGGIIAQCIGILRPQYARRAYQSRDYN